MKRVIQVQRARAANLVIEASAAPLGRWASAAFQVIGARRVIRVNPVYKVSAASAVLPAPSAL